MISKTTRRANNSFVSRVDSEKKLLGNEGLAIASLHKAFDKCGYDDVFIDEYGSIIGYIKGKAFWKENTV